MDYEDRKEFERLVCVKSTGISHVYDFWVERDNNIAGRKTYHYVKPRYIEKAMELLLGNGGLQPIDQLENYKKGELWKP